MHSTPARARTGTLVRFAASVAVAGLLLAPGCATPSKSTGTTAAKPAGEPGRYALVDGKPITPPSIRMGDPRTVDRLITLAKADDAQVMAHLKALSVDHGPRLTGSANALKASQWAVDQLKSWGWDARLEQWGDIATGYDRGPQWSRVLVKTAATRRGETRTRGDDRDSSRPADGIARPDAPEGYRVLRDLQFTTLAWTRGTDGPRRGPIIRMPLTPGDYEKAKDNLKGAWILVPRIPLSESPGVDSRRGGNLRARFEQRADARKKLAEGKPLDDMSVEQKVILSGVAGFISASVDDRVWTSSAPNWRTREAKDYAPDIELTVRLSDYDYISSRLTDGDPIEFEANLPVTLTPGPVPVYNVVADLKGTEKPDELVILCAHLDSWNGPGSQGTVDNGTGTAVMLEAARLLAAADAKPKRTVRVILWTGEEQGLLGARAYVKANKDQWPRISAVFNDDGGTNTQGGLAVIREMVPYLAAATAPVNGRFYSPTDGKYLDVNLRVQEKFTQVAASDHYAFVEAGIPGFYWDEVGRADYWYAWHTQNDRLDQGIEEYLRQSAATSAVTAYNLASAPELLPRWTPDTPTQTTPVTPDGPGPGQQPR